MHTKLSDYLCKSASTKPDRTTHHWVTACARSLKCIEACSCKWLYVSSPVVEEVNITILDDNLMSFPEPFHNLTDGVLLLAVR